MFLWYMLPHGKQRAINCNVLSIFTAILYVKSPTFWFTFINSPEQLERSDLFGICTQLAHQCVPTKSYYCGYQYHCTGTFIKRSLEMTMSRTWSAGTLRLIRIAFLFTLRSISCSCEAAVQVIFIRTTVIHLNTIVVSFCPCHPAISTKSLTAGNGVLHGTGPFYNCPRFIPHVRTCNQISDH